MLDSPMRIFRCPICVQEGVCAPNQDLSLLVEHLAKHYDFRLFECQQCKKSFATPFVANYHIKEGRCKSANIKSLDKKVMSTKSIEEIEFSAFCQLQNAITKCIQDMLEEHKSKSLLS
ncbi:hypothetical protein Q1695_000211 [Nippostrongylus brasiliensis]|nr:hypothetical protein Q1695_000211 [Nippostrongylus brasiliensis]